MRIIQGVSVCLFLCLSLTGCGEKKAATSASSSDESSRSSELTRVTLQLNWFPEVEHGGYYAALVHGFFVEEGLDVQILPGGPSAPVIQLVDGGRVDFGITNADQVLFAHDAGAELVSLFAPLQASPRCILVHESTGITSLHQLRDVTLAVGSTAAFFRYMALKVPLENVQIVAYAGSVAPLLDNPRYAQQGYVFSEPFLAEQAGAKVRTLMVSDLGYNPYTSLLVARDELIRERPGMVAKMVRASRRGWQHYLRDPDATNIRIGKENPEMSAAALAYGAVQMKPLCLPPGTAPEQLGTMTLARWQELAAQMREAELIDSVDVQAAFTTQFLAALPR
jgi:NitT/TauT family transport system substrate-binding protein